MEAYLWIFLALILALCIYSISYRKKQEKARLEQLKLNFGKPDANKLTHEHLQKLEEAAAVFGQNIDSGLINDMNMNEVFEHLDQSISSIGEEYFYFSLRNISKDAKTINKRQRLFTQISEKSDDEGIAKLRYRLSSIEKHEKITTYECMNNLKSAPVDSTAFHIICLALFIISVLSMFIIPKFGLPAVFIIACFNCVTYIKRKGVIAEYDGAVTSLISWLNALPEVINTDINSEELNDIFGKIGILLKNFDSVNKMAWLLSPKSVVASIVEIFMDYIKFLTHIDLIKFNMSVKCLKGHEEELNELYVLTGEIELAIISIGISRFSQSFCQAIIEEKSDKAITRLSIKGMSHPLLANSIENDCITERPILITGSNASGKSTYLRMIGINMIFAETLGFAFCREYRAGLFEIRSSMTITDDIACGDSFYLAEIKRIKEILDYSSKDIPMVVLVDEILRGTNTLERVAASTEILRYLESRNVIVIAATHDIELTQELKNIYDCYYFTEEIDNIDNDRNIFDYKIYKGTSYNRNAIKLLERYGYPKEIVEKSYEAVNK